MLEPPVLLRLAKLLPTDAHHMLGSDVARFEPVREKPFLHHLVGREPEPPIVFRDHETLGAARGPPPHQPRGPLDHRVAHV